MVRGHPSNLEDVHDNGVFGGESKAPILVFTTFAAEAGRSRLPSLSLKAAMATFQKTN